MTGRATAVRVRGAPRGAPFRSGAAFGDLPRTSFFPRQDGAALFIALVLLLMMTVLAVSGMGTASLELALAGNEQTQQQAFHAAESGIGLAIARRAFRTAEPSALHAGFGAAEVDVTTAYRESTGVPDRAYSLGVGSGFRALHFDIVAVGRGPRGATSTHRQGVFLVAPGEP